MHKIRSLPTNAGTPLSHSMGIGVAQGWLSNWKHVSFGEQCIRSSSCPPPHALLSHVPIFSLKWAYVVYAIFGGSGKQTRRRCPCERKVSDPKTSQKGREQTYCARSMTLGAAITGQSPRGSSLTVEWRIFNGARVGTDPILFQCPWQCRGGMYLYMAFPGWFAPSISLWARP